MSRLIRSLHKLAGPPDAERLRDEQLLERFVAGRDQAAFELLLWRHGPMVLGVCRRVLRDTQDAEDAFQATWLTFVKKAAAIVRREAVGSWLYQVAYRVALRARAGRAKRSSREQIDPDRLAAVPADESGEVGELGGLIEEEVRRLPSRQRAAFVLCCLEGCTGEEAARELGCPPGTVSSRLTRARERLRHRLTRGGLAPAAAALTGAAAGEARSCHLPAALADSTVKAVLLFSSGQAAGGALSAHAVTLAEGVLRAMLVTKLKIAAMVMLTVGALAAGGVFTHHALTAAPPGEKEQPTKPEKPAPNADAPPETGPAKVLAELRRKRVEAARAVYEQNLGRIRAGQGLPIELLGSSERWLNAELGRGELNFQEKRAAYRDHVLRTREVERLLVNYEKTGQGKASDAAAATYERIDAEIRYTEFVLKPPPPAPEVKSHPKDPER
jgi:RNA polymerase sigma factor (sigma-70 family)